ncbi:MAG: DNA mismatch repair protein MutS, partial [Bdellovibrionales bacterium]
MQQFWQIKSAHTDKILLFRMGDFFEMFHQDAEVAAPILGIALTSRNRKSGDDTKMCGVPHHSIAGPIAKLLAAGHKVAICDQIEDPATAKGLVKRAVTRILSPGMVYDPATLDQMSGNYICAYDDVSVSFLEPTTGEAFYYKTSAPEARERLWHLLCPRELILTAEQRQALGPQPDHWRVHLTVVESLKTEEAAALPSSAVRLLEYAANMQGAELRQTVRDWQSRDLHRHLDLSATTVRHLELLQTFKGDRRGSLLHAVDRTKTAAGARTLKHWLQFPLSDLGEILARQEQVAFWTQNSEALKAVRDVLATMGDIERRLGKIANPNCNARDLLALAQSLRAGLTVAPLCPPQEGEAELIELANGLATRMENELVEDPPLATRQGGIFKRSVMKALDELIDLTEDAQKLLLELEQREREQSGINSLKVRFNNVFGYYLEVTNTHTHKVPARYQRKQTLANAERYTTDELATLEAKILSAHAKRGELESEMFHALRAKILQASADLLQLARRWSELDVFTGLAWLALEREYVRPTFTKTELNLKSSRHPVVEQEIQQTFVANDIILKNGECLLLTGPNMAGKSTLMRQVAVAVILAQVGSFVPAADAELPVFTSIFTRIGASDFLSEGLSTFMVEMKEAAEILARADPRSLVILDE